MERIQFAITIVLLCTLSCARTPEEEALEEFKERFREAVIAAREHENEGEASCRTAAETPWREGEPVLKLSMRDWFEGPRESLLPREELNGQLVQWSGYAQPIPTTRFLVVTNRPPGSRELPRYQFLFSLRDPFNGQKRPPPGAFVQIKGRLALTQDGTDRVCDSVIVSARPPG